MEPSAAELFTLAAAVVAGSALQAATGFGFAIVAAPVFLAVLQSTAAIPVLVALHVVQCVILVPRIWNGIPWADFGRLAAGALFGCPAGLLIFQMLDVRQLKLSVGIVILLVTCLMVWRQMRNRATAMSSPGYMALRGTGLDRVVTGALSGALTAVLVMPGPPMMVSLLRNPLPATNARALSIGFFAVCYLTVFAVHVAAGELDMKALPIIGWLTVPVVLGTFIGLYGAQWLLDRYFAPLMTVLLIVAGLGAIISAL